MNLNLPELIIAANGEANYADRVSSMVKGAVAARKKGSRDYQKRIEKFLWFLNSGGSKPFGVSEADFRRFKPIAERLVQEGVWNADALNVFEQPGTA